MKKLNKKGFTLIEVVLVLAIGGLIFLLAFLAFSQASKNRRDTQRRSDAGRLVSEASNYKGDFSALPPNVTTGGAAGSTTIAPTGANTFINKYMGGTSFKTPTGTAYTIDVSSPTATPNADHVNYAINYVCSPTGGLTSTNGSGHFAVQIGLEKGVACRDDQ